MIAPWLFLVLLFIAQARFNLRWCGVSHVMLLIHITLGVLASFPHQTTYRVYHFSERRHLIITTWVNRSCIISYVLAFSRLSTSNVFCLGIAAIECSWTSEPSSQGTQYCLPSCAAYNVERHSKCAVQLNLASTRSSHVRALKFDMSPVT